MPGPLIALIPAIAGATARAAPSAVGKATAQSAAKGAAKAAPKPPAPKPAAPKPAAPKPQPPKQNNPPKPKDDKKPGQKKDEKKPEQNKDDKKPEPKKDDKKPEQKDEKKPEPKKDDKKPEQKDEKKPEQKKDEKKPDDKKQDNKPGQKKDEKKPDDKKQNNKQKKPTGGCEKREELTEQALDTTSQVIDRITNRPGRDDDATSDSLKLAGPKPKNPVVAPKAPKAGDVLVSLAVKNNGQDWFWFVHHPTETNTGMTMHVEGTITKGFTVKLTRKTTVEKLESAMGTKSLELIKLQWVEKRWWDEDMFAPNKAAKAEAPFETTAYGVKPPTVTECAPVKETATEMAMDRMTARIKRKDDKTWVLESCEALVRAGALKQNVLTFLEKLKDSYGTLGGKKPTSPNVSPANPGKQPICGTPSKCGDSLPTKTNRPNTPSTPGNATPRKTGNATPGKPGNGTPKKGVTGKPPAINAAAVNK